MKREGVPRKALSPDALTRYALSLYPPPREYPAATQRVPGPVRWERGFLSECEGSSPYLAVCTPFLRA